MIPAILKTRFGTNEILVSLLLVYVAEATAGVDGARRLLRNPDGMRAFPARRNLSQIFPPVRHNGFRS